MTQKLNRVYLGDLVLTQALNAIVATPATDVSSLMSLGLIIETTGVVANNGTFKVQVRCIPQKAVDGYNQQQTSSWADIPFTASLTLNSQNVIIPLSVDKMYWDQIRVVFVGGAASSNGIAKVFLTQKTGN